MEATDCESRIESKPGRRPRLLSVVSRNNWRVMSGKVDAIFIANMQYSDEAGVQMASFFRIYDHKLSCSRRAESTKESQEWEYTD